jgi:hypothetical protein
VGIGDPLEAEFELLAPIPAGSWTFVGDGIIIEPVDVLFEIIWRSDAGDDVIWSLPTHFDPQGNGNFDAVPFEQTAELAAVPAAGQDQLVLRYSAMNATIGSGFAWRRGGCDLRIRFISCCQPAIVVASAAMKPSSHAHRSRSLAHSPARAAAPHPADRDHRDRPG